MHKALSMYKDHRVTLWRAAEIAGVSLSELLAELPKQKIIFQYDMAELNEDLEFSCGRPSEHHFFLEEQRFARSRHGPPYETAESILQLVD